MKEIKKYVYLVYSIGLNDKDLIKVFDTLEKALAFKSEQVNLDMQGNNELSLDDALDLYAIDKEEVH